MRTYRGLAASVGVAIGPALLYLPQERLVAVTTGPTDPAEETRCLDEAIATAQEQLRRVYEQAVLEVGEETAAIFQAHEEFLSDPDLLDTVRAQITENGLRAEAAVEVGFEGFAQQMEALDDEYLRERAVDLRDVSRRVQRILIGSEDQDILVHMNRATIVVARDLTPSDTAQMNKAMVLGFCTATGGLTSHTAIIARILGIPAVVGLGADVLALESGQTIIVDGTHGLVIADPGEQTLATYQQTQQAAAAERQRVKEAAQAKAAAQDGHHVEVVANIADAQSGEIALSYGAEGVGLFRTEYLFLNRLAMPSEEEQYRDYRAVADVFGDRPLVIRTIDIGGDKQVPYLNFGAEMNPFLGWRAIRMCLDRPDFFKLQLRALLRAAVDRNVQVMFPMIATVSEVRAARQLLEEAKTELEKEGVPYNHHMPVGIMVEIPAAAVGADILAPEVDFFSIGTNDLIQYTLACDRGNEKVAYLYDPLHPVILRLIKNVIDAAHRAGKWVGMCGEMAGDLEAIPILLGLGLDEFSMNAPVIPQAKVLIASLTMQRAQEIAAEALARPTAEEVGAYIQSLRLLK